MGSTVSKYHYNQARARACCSHAAAMLSDPCQCGQEGKPGLVIKKLRISNGLFNLKCPQRLTGDRPLVSSFPWQLNEFINYFNLALICEWCSNLQHCSCCWETSRENTSLNLSGPFPFSINHSVSQSEVQICCSLICIPGWWGNSSLGLPLTADPNPSQATGQPSAFIIFTLQGSVQQNLSLEQEIVTSISKTLTVHALFCIHEKLKAGVGGPGGYLLESRYLQPSCRQLSASCMD